MASLTLEETARTLTRYHQVESLLFEVMGDWSGTVPEPEIKVALSAHAQEHAWHAALWRDRLPALGAAGSRQSGRSAPENLVLALRRFESPDQTIEKLVGIYRVLLPHMVVAYSRHLSKASPLSDGPITRALKLVLNDEIEEWRQGEGLVHDLLMSSDEVGRAATHQGRLESLFVQSEHEVGQALPL